MEIQKMWPLMPPEPICEVKTWKSNVFTSVLCITNNHEAGSFPPPGGYVGSTIDCGNLARYRDTRKVTSNATGADFWGKDLTKHFIYFCAMHYLWSWSRFITSTRRLSWINNTLRKPSEIWRTRKVTSDATRADLWGKDLTKQCIYFCAMHY